MILVLVKRKLIPNTQSDRMQQEKHFMYLRAVLCSFQISEDFYYVPVGGRGGLEKGGWRRGGWRRGGG
jgi:hypothetical protein